MYSVRINGYLVEGDDKAVAYLDHLDSGEAKVLLREARLYGPAKFEHNFLNYTLTWNKNTSTYTVEKR
ncbi:MAG: hypothetical protein PHI73_03980 [Patescibacteria group bacterium]|nr:hypothetical protein [Patescibacteria group bacterium]